MPVTIKNSSILMFTDLKSVDGIEFWDIVDLPKFYARDTDISYQVADGDRLDRIASKYYGDPGLWWVIAWANDIELAQRNMVAGIVLIVPDPNYVQNQLFKTRRSKA